MFVYYTAEGTVVLEVAEAALEMTRGEAEELFVQLGRSLQDMDVTMFSNETGDDSEQPDG